MWLKIAPTKRAVRLTLSLAVLAVCTYARAGTGDATISAPSLGSRIVIRTADRFAGAIYSLEWNGKEFINSYDHGRELQSASSFDYLGECFNPTEAGSSADGTGATSTSVLKGLEAGGNWLATTTQMAFWLRAHAPYTYPDTPPGEPATGCGKKPIWEAQNATDLSNHDLDKRVTIHYRSITNAIEYRVAFHVPGTEPAHQLAQFEVLTGYLAGDFTSFYTYDPATRSLTPLTTAAGEQALPIIMSTPDSRYAMGIYSPDMPIGTDPSNGYGRFAFPVAHTMKWNVVYRFKAPLRTRYDFVNYVVVGTVADVMTGIRALYDSFRPTRPVYRYYSDGDAEHFMTVDPSEAAHTGRFLYEGIGFNVYNKAASVANPLELFRCLHRGAGKHFVSAFKDCEGETVEGSYGFIRSSKSVGASPLYRFRHPTHNDYLVTTSKEEGEKASYVLDGILGWVPSTLRRPSSATVPRGHQ
jgi:hypothetical protein